MSGPQWRNVNASFNASQRDTMVVVAGRLTALKTGTFYWLSHSRWRRQCRQRTGRGQPEGGDDGVICRLRGCFRVLSLSGAPVERHNSFSFDNRLIGKNYETIVQHGTSAEWSGCAWKRKRAQTGRRRVLTRSRNVLFTIRPARVSRQLSVTRTPGLTLFNATTSSANP